MTAYAKTSSDSAVFISRLRALAARQKIQEKSRSVGIKMVGAMFVKYAEGATSDQELSVIPIEVGIGFP